MFTKHINIINPSAVEQALTDAMCGKFGELSARDFWIPFQDVHPMTEYKAPEKFPKCCGYHSGILGAVNEWFSKFPKCCSDHSKLLGTKWFNKGEFKNVALKVVTQIHYTSYLIEDRLKNQDWYEDITDYIEYNVSSFGQLPAGYGGPVGLDAYLKGLKSEIEKDKKKVKLLTPERSKKLIEFIDSYYEPGKSSNINLNELSTVYKNWLAAFPFQIEFFSELKKYYSARLPIMQEKGVFNRYKGITAFKIITKSELLNNLYKTTIHLLRNINTSVLLKEGIIADTNKYEIDLKCESHKLKQAQLLEAYSKEELKYIDVLRKWLKAEKEFFKDLEPLIKTKQPIPMHFKTEIREIYDNKYLKVFLRDKNLLRDIAGIIQALASVKKVNISTTDNNAKQNLTVYPSELYSIVETKEEIEFTLNNYFSRGQLDPIFPTETISNVSDAAYRQIIDLILNFGKNLEKFQRLYEHFGEEDYRNFFLPCLNTVSRNHNATGEAFNKIGKTDILIQNADGLNVFIAECKLWKGSEELKNAISQLLERYVTWRDEKVALIVFNNSMQKFSELIGKAIETVKGHPLYDSGPTPSQDSSFSFVFKHPDDPQRKIMLELILFNCIQTNPS